MNGALGIVADQRGVALAWWQNNVLCHEVISPDGRGISERLPALLAVTPQYFSWACLHDIYVMVGPGSFTAVRAALAAAQGLALATNAAIHGVGAGGWLRSSAGNPNAWVAIDSCRNDYYVFAPAVADDAGCVMSRPALTALQPLLIDQPHPDLPHALSQPLTARTLRAAAAQQTLPAVPLYGRPADVTVSA